MRLQILGALIAVHMMGSCHVLLSRELVDRIIARVNDVNIYESDRREPQLSLGGKSRTLDMCIEDELWRQKAHAYNVEISDVDVQKRIVALREGQGFGYQSQAAYESFLRGVGLSIKRLGDQIKRVGAIAEIKNFLSPKDALVTQEEVAAYCHEHPIYKDEEYLLSFATVEPYMLDENGAYNKQAYPVSWSELDGWIKKGDLAQDMDFVSTMERGEISMPREKAGTLFVYRLENKSPRRELTPDERKAEVEGVLLKVKKIEKEQDLKERLRSQASIAVFA